MLLKTGLPLITAGVSMLMDIRDTRVDNNWLVFMMLQGLIHRLITEGFEGIPSFLFGMLCPFLLLFWLFFFHMLGPGDIKLLCVLGGMLGMKKIAVSIVCSFLLGGWISLLLLIFCGEPKDRLLYFFHYLKNLKETHVVKPYYRTGMLLENFHFTVPVFLSMVLYAGGLI